MTERKILYFHPSREETDLRRDLHAAGWCFESARAPATLRFMMRTAEARVGLAIFDRFDDDTWPEIESLFSSSHTIKWTALASEPVLERRNVRKLLYDHFYDVLPLPADTSQVSLMLEKALRMAALYDPTDSQVKQINKHKLVGESPALHTVLQDVAKVARVDAPVLITGESGTGKELMAREIHERSARSKGPFVAVNCGALPANLIQSELFGHDKGAFTGAHQRKIGRIEAAEGGTILLDEIGDLPLDLQVNLLRFLQEGQIERVGSSQSIPVDVRVIAATHVDLEQAVEDGKFRADLYYRLNVLSIHAPALRERAGDIELLARVFFAKYSNEKNNCVKGFSRQALTAMNQYTWPGNVRELMNSIRQAMVMCEKPFIGAHDLGMQAEPSARPFMDLQEAREGAEKEVLEASLLRANYNVSKAARQLGISRLTLYRLLKKHDMSTEPPTRPRKSASTERAQGERSGTR